MIEATKLTKRFGKFTAVDQLDLNVAPGERYGFLGPNGAGKSTTLAMLLGILKPTSGECRIHGEPVRNDSFDLKQRIGFVPEYEAFYGEMTSEEYLTFYAQLYNVEGAGKRMDELLSRVGLLQWKDTLVENFSAGMKKKLGVVRALLHSPQVLILDEPVSGLDPFGIIQIRELLTLEHQAGCTIFLSSHILSEVERIVDRVGIITHGKIIAEDTMENIRRKVGGVQRIEIELMAVPDDLVAMLTALPFVSQIQRRDNQLIISTDTEADYRERISRMISERQLVILQMKHTPTTLEEAFVTLTDSNIQHLTAGQGLKGEETQA